LSYYIFKFTKGDSVLQAETQDTELLSREFEKSVADAFGITCEKPKKSFYKKPSNFEMEKRPFQQSVQYKKPASMTEVSEKKKAVDQVSKEFESFLQKGNQSVERQLPLKVDPKPLAKIEIPEQPEVKVIEPILIEKPIVTEQANPGFEMISPDDLFKEETNEIVTFKPEQPAVPAYNQVTPEADVDIDLSSNEVNNPLLTEQAENINNYSADIAPEEVSSENQNSFENVLQKKVSSPISSMEEVKSIEDLIALKSPANMLGYLVIAAYYLKYFEKLDSYSLKQLNLKVLPIAKVPVNHAVIQEAINSNYLEVVPDYTGTAYVSEYTITDAGANYVQNEL